MKKFGLIGEKLPHSFSKILHNIAFEVLDLDYGYDLYEIDLNTAKDIKSFMIENELDGINVTIPYKETVMESLDHISEEAEKIGAVNTIKNVGGKLYGYNTDYYGFLYTLNSNNINIDNKTVVILGSGGASKAVVECVKDLKAKSIYLVSRNKNDKKTKDGIALIDYNDLKDIRGEVLINTTPVGMYPKTDFSPVGKDIISNFNNVVDVVYNPLETKLMKIADSLGKKSFSGLTMLIMQGLKSEEIWNDFKFTEEEINIIVNKVKKEI